MSQPFKENAKAKGGFVFTKNRLETPEQFDLARRIDEARASGGYFMKLVRQLNDLSMRLGLQETFFAENIVPTTGRANIANNMTSVSPTYPILVNKFAVGSGTNTPANADTQLQTEVYRNDVASRTNASNVAYITGFLNATESSGTYREAGLFCGGTATANSGSLMSRVAINITKSLTETLTIDWTFTLT